MRLQRYFKNGITLSIEMESSHYKSHWLAPLKSGTHACFFYTTHEEFFSIAVPFLQNSLTTIKERTLWILPPRFSFQDAKEILLRHLSLNLDAMLRLRRLLILPWDKWYGAELSTQDLLKRKKQILKETQRAGYEGLRILSHSPSKDSNYWKDFLLHEEAVSKSKLKGILYLCGYSLVDCPVPAISLIASNHTHCLIHHEQEWEWLLNQPSTNLYRSTSSGSTKHSS